VPGRRVAWGAFALVLLALGAVTYHRGVWSRPHLFWLVPLILVVKFMMSNGRGRDPEVISSPSGSVAVIVPIFNEDPAMLYQTLVSLHGQSRRPQSIHVIDDGSTSDAGARVAERLKPVFASIGVDYRVTRYQENRGKREALAVGIEAAPDADIYVCIDSDTRLHRDAVRYIVRPLADPGVTGATGLVLAANHNRNLLTRLVDLRYATAFLLERAAYSSLGSVLCCCGSLAAYRGPVVRRYLHDFLNQRFLGRRATFGDDRRLTNYCLLEGQVVLERRAIAETVVPERFGHYLRQQVRWNKSFFRESFWCIQHMPWRKPAFFLSLFELSMWILFSFLIVLSLTRPMHQGLHLLGGYLVFVALMGYARSVRYFEVTHRPVSRSERLRVYLLAPVYSCLHLVMLVPLRFYSLATLHMNGWGTRRRVEVRVAAEQAVVDLVATSAPPADVLSAADPSPVVPIAGRLPAAGSDRRLASAAYFHPVRAPAAVGRPTLHAVDVRGGAVVVQPPRVSAVPGAVRR
jgi:hyaluronan synthase